MNSTSQQHNINMPNASQSPSPPPKLPHAHLLDGSRVDYLDICVPLYKSCIKGDWKATKAIIDKRLDLIRSSITVNCDTPLHIAASSSKSARLVRYLVSLMNGEDLELQNKNHDTALCLAAAGGNVEIAEIMISKNKKLLTISGSQGMIPLHMAALFGNHDMARYLYDNSQQMTGESWTSLNRRWVLQKCVEADFFDIALQIVTDCPELALSGDVLGVLARKPNAFEGTKHHIMWRIINSIIRQKSEPLKNESQALQLLQIVCKAIMKLPTAEVDKIICGLPGQILFVAVRTGNVRFIIELIRYYPDLIWKVNDANLTIFHKAVRRRHEKIYNLLYEIGSVKSLITLIIDKNGNNMLHLVGQSAKTKRFQRVSGVALQMQRELLWFKEVEKMVPPSFRNIKNNAGKTPDELFTSKHKDLVTQGEKWLKETAAQCMVVATLIATIVFAAAFTVPGGYNQDNGFPIFLGKKSFMIFIISDSISLFSSSTSILMFLSILTSRCAESDFLESLPKKLMLGLVTLFLSITSMMVTFSVSFFVLYHNKFRWVALLMTMFSMVLVILFVRLHFQLLWDLFCSTYASRYLFKPKKLMLY